MNRESHRNRQRPGPLLAAALPGPRRLLILSRIAKKGEGSGRSGKRHARRPHNRAGDPIGQGPRPHRDLPARGLPVNRVHHRDGRRRRPAGSRANPPRPRRSIHDHPRRLRREHRPSRRQTGVAGKETPAAGSILSGGSSTAPGPDFSPAGTIDGPSERDGPPKAIVFTASARPSALPASRHRAQVFGRVELATVACGGDPVRRAPRPAARIRAMAPPSRPRL